jgi:hypothetical protein
MKPTLSVDYGLCECGCGERTAVAHVNDRSKGWDKGKHLRFRKGHVVLEKRQNRIREILAHHTFMRYSRV